jgi:hypothetical protein
VRTLALLLLLAASAASTPRAATDVGALAPIRTWVWHFDPEMAGGLFETYRSLLDALPDDTEVLVAVACEEDAELFCSQFAYGEALDPRMSVIIAGPRLSGWARDRYFLFRRAGHRIALLPDADSVAAYRRDDLAVPHDLPERCAPEEVVESHLDLEGGNVVLTREHVMVGYGAIVDNLDRFQGDRVALEHEIERLFGRRLIVIGESLEDLPHEHLDMFLAVAGERVVLLGDPRLVQETEGEEPVPIGTMPDRKQLAFFAAAERTLRQAGYRVERIPLLSGDVEEYYTWTNAVVEVRRGRPRAYVPEYGIPTLDRRAHAVWRRLGYRVFPVAAGSLIHHGGAVRCATNVIR